MARTRKGAPARSRQGMRRAETVHVYEGHPETMPKKKARKSEGSEQPKRKLPKPYLALIKEALRVSPCSQISIERYILTTYPGTTVSRNYLKNAIERAIETNQIERVARHKNTFQIKREAPAAASSRRAPRPRTTRTARAAAFSNPTPTPGGVYITPAAGPVIAKSWEFNLNAKAFGVFADDEHVFAADESGLIAKVGHDGTLASLYTLEEGVKCLVADSEFFFAGCNNGALYDLTSGVPRMVAQLEQFSQIYWVDIFQGRMVASDGSGHVALVNCEGETEWSKKSEGEDGWMVRVDYDGVYHGHSKGVTKYDHQGNRQWHTPTAPVLFGWQEEKHVYASLVEPGCFDGEIAKRLKREGAKSGEVVISLMWNNRDDLDLHVVCPSGEEISYMHKNSRCGGELDVDMNTFSTMSNEPVENIYWSSAPLGKYKINVVMFSKRGNEAQVPFEVHVKIRDQVLKFDKTIASGSVAVHEFELGAQQSAGDAMQDEGEGEGEDAKEKGPLPERCVVKINKETGKIEGRFPCGSSVPSVTTAKDGKRVFAAVPNAIKCFGDDGNEQWQLWTGAGNAMSMQLREDVLYAVCANRLVAMDVSEAAVGKAKQGQGAAPRTIHRDRSVSERGSLNENEVQAVSDAGDGVVVECVEMGGKVRVRPKTGQRYDSSKNVQFPRNIRQVGRQFVVDKLVLCGSFYRVQGEIKRLQS